MALPRNGLVAGIRPAGRVAPSVPLDSRVTELRVHGVGGVSPGALLGDVSPQQVGGDGVAGFYRTADLPAHDGAPTRHVEGYSWGGLTSRSGVRVFWLVLLPFLLANIAGWAFRGDGSVKPSGPWFAWHRITANLACLALTVNTVLVAVLIGPDVISYQATRAGLIGSQRWLWPWNWTWIRDHGERPLVLGFALVLFAVAVLVLLAVRTQNRYESVLPPWRLEEEGATAEEREAGRPRTSAADTVLSEPAFWNSARAVRRMTGAHVGAALGFLTITFALTARAASIQPRALGWWWAALVVGTVALTVSVVVVAGDRWARHFAGGRFGKGLSQVMIHAVAPAGLVCAGVFSWLQPGMVRTTGSLPGMDGIIAYTYAAIAVPVVLLAAGALLRRLVTKTVPTGPRLTGGPVAAMLIATVLLNALLLSALFTVAHLIGSFLPEPVSDPTALAVPLPLVWAGPTLIVAAALALVVTALIQLPRLRGDLRNPRNFTENYRDYGKEAQPEGTSTADSDWYTSTVPRDGGPAQTRVQVDPPGARKAWRSTVLKAYREAELRSVLGVLIWLVAAFPVVAIVLVVVLRPAVPDAWFSPNGALGKAGIFLSGAALAATMWLLRQSWQDLTKRRQIGRIWDVGTFWPRSFHPFAPPCYAERAVPDLQRRIWRLNDSGSRVLLVAHSQGSLLTAAALLPRATRAHSGKIAWITFGNPATWLYSWVFSGWINPEVLGLILRNDEDSSQVTAWENFWYPTDPIGHRLQVTPPAPGARPSARLRDERLADPRTAWHVYGDPAPTARGHSGYWDDPRVWARVDIISRELT